MSSYVKSAEIYDALYHFKNYEHDVQYVIDEILKRRPRARTMLDVACGTGNHIQLLKDRFEVEGLDLSEHMLSMARNKFPDISFHQGSIIDFNMEARFDVITCLFRSIAYVKTSENMRASIHAMSRHLSPGGLLVIEPYFTPVTYWSNRVTLNEASKSDLKIAWMYVSERQGDVSVLNTHYLVGRPDGVEHFTEAHELGLFKPEEIETAFRDAGLEVEYDPVGPTNVGLYIGHKST